MPNSRKEVSDCPVETALAVIGGRWKAQILWNLLYEGPLRYGRLRRALPGVAETVLIRQLRELECDGVVVRRTFDTVPPAVEYALTPLGESLRPVIESMLAWSMKHRRDVLGILGGADAEGLRASD
jgi:DNA-binding HxlR family transcriptional regulator